ncbi:MAG: hypothetical protein H7X89_15085 [Rhizobiales bacterium]|nr:hypothetical protein [Hyphomicrobiales bacterium]
MHILLGLAAVIGGLAFWWWRFKMVKQATDEIGDVAGRVWGQYKCHKFRKKVEDSPLEAVDDPVAAAVVMMLAVAKEAGPITPEVEASAHGEITTAMKIADPTELLVFSKWVASHVDDANNVSLRYAKLWAGALNIEERREFIGMVERVAQAPDGTTAAQNAKIAKLRERLGLTP